MFMTRSMKYVMTSCFRATRDDHTSATMTMMMMMMSIPLSCPYYHNNNCYYIGQVYIYPLNELPQCDMILYNYYVLNLCVSLSLSIVCFIFSGKPLARIVWLRDGHVIDDTYMTTFESTVRNDLWLPSLDRRDADATLTCEASNSNLTQPLTTSVTIDLLRN